MINPNWPNNTHLEDKVFLVPIFIHMTQIRNFI